MGSLRTLQILGADGMLQRRFNSNLSLIVIYTVQRTFAAQYIISSSFLM